VPHFINDIIACLSNPSRPDFRYDMHLWATAHRAVDLNQPAVFQTWANAPYQGDLTLPTIVVLIAEMVESQDDV
jgi:hypothetical protein